MPVTAKLSRKFYERFGDDIANELVNWFNTVDATYRADLRQFNELNFARFDSSMEARLARIDTKLAELKSELLRWMLLLWAPTALGVLGTAVSTVVLLLRR
jgi:hypothetical protein